MTDGHACCAPKQVCIPDGAEQTRAISQGAACIFGITASVGCRQGLLAMTTLTANPRQPPQPTGSRAGAAHPPAGAYLTDLISASIPCGQTPLLLPSLLVLSPSPLTLSLLLFLLIHLATPLVLILFFCAPRPASERDPRSPKSPHHSKHLNNPRHRSHPEPTEPRARDPQGRTADSSSMPILTLLGQCAAMGGASMAVGSVPLVFKDSMSRKWLCYRRAGKRVAARRCGRPRRYSRVRRSARGTRNAPFTSEDGRTSGRAGDISRELSVTSEPRDR